MAWERRGDNLYYYQAEKREDGRVQKRYVGSGGMTGTHSPRRRHVAED